MSDDVSVAKARLARLWANGGKPTDAEVSEARSALAYAKALREVHAFRDQLNAEQKGELAALLLSA